MKNLRTMLFRYGTPFTLGLFLISTISGLFLYFHLWTNLFREMHEILSLILLIPVVVHIWRNWPVFANYFRRRAMPMSLAVCLILAAPFVYEGLSKPSGGNPAFALMMAAQKVSLTKLAPVLGLDEASALKRLRDAGFTDVAGSDTIAAIAVRAKTSPMAILAQLTAPSR